ncbi:MAG: AsmA-like C-terminal domain-containing protein, partial [Hyphomonas sp.]
FTLGADSRLITADLREAFFRNVADVSGAVQRDPGDRLTLSLRGKYLDISGLFAGLGGMASAAGAEPEEGTPLTIAAQVDRLILREGLDLRQARLLAVTGTRGLQSLEASGLALGGAPLSARLTATGGAPIKIDVTSGDAGFIASAFLGADFITGGELALSGALEMGENPADLLLQLTNARMSNAPFLTQILSLASLRGLADTLSGEGVMFSRIDIPMKVSGGRYVVSGAKAQGPALGLTASGYVDLTTQAIEIDGVLVPSFGMNSALGGIPIIGDLVVGRDGEGVFSLTYSVRGTLEKANVSVNPLSALAPGVIRRVFENPSDTKIPEAAPRPPDQALPNELPPLKEEEF